jgi:hypothetical protein
VAAVVVAGQTLQVLLADQVAGLLVVEVPQVQVARVKVMRALL